MKTLEIDELEHQIKIFDLSINLEIACVDIIKKYVAKHILETVEAELIETILERSINRQLNENFNTN